MILTFMWINLNYSSHYLSISVSLMILYIECIQLAENLFSKSKQEGAPVLVCCSMIIQLMYLMRLGGCRGEELEDHKISIVMIYLIKDSWRSLLTIFSKLTNYSLLGERFGLAKPAIYLQQPGH